MPQATPQDNVLRSAPVHGDSLLTSLAIINVNWEDRRESYLDNFVPFAIGAMQADARMSYSEGDVRGLMEHRFGLNLPVKVVASLLGRAVRKKLVKKDRRAYVLVEGASRKVPNIAQQQADCSRKQNNLISLLVTFAQDRFEFTWTPDEAENALVGFIQGHSVSLLNMAVRGGGALENQETQGTTYIVTSFITEVIESDPAAFAYLDQMVKGSMLASALYLPTPGDVQRRFKNTTLYLDTPVALRALGHEGEDARQATQQMLTLAGAQGARLACFTHTLKEVRGVLESAKGAIRRSAGSESATRGVNLHFVQSRASEQDINLHIERLERDLKHLRVSVIEKPDHVVALTVNEDALDEHLKARINYLRPTARATDLDSLTAIHRLRNGSSGPYLETCGAVLVTDNSGVVGAARDHFDSGLHEWPIAMMDHDLAALVWVKEPHAAPELPQRQIIADCYAALAPSQALWAKITDEISRLQARGGITAEDVALLRHSNEAQRSIMDTTLGDPSRVSPKAIQEALQRARDLIVDPITREREEAEQRAVEAERQEAVARFDAAQEEINNQELKNKVDRLEARESRVRAGIETRAAKQANRVVWALRVAGFVIVVAGTVSLVPNVDSHLNDVLSWFLRGAGVVVIILSALSLFSGGSMHLWIGKVGESFRSRLVAKGLQEHGWDDED